MTLIQIHKFAAAFGVAYLLILAAPCCSAGLAPGCEAVLEIRGKIGISNNGNTVWLDMQQLDRLSQHSLRMETPWTDGVVTFEGPLLRDVLSLVGSKGRWVTAIALNDSEMEIPVSDAHDYPVIVATSMNGNKMKVRNRGPLWIMYPFGEYKKLRSESYYMRAIWQLRTLIVHD